jgi:spermidine synthase
MHIIFDEASSVGAYHVKVFKINENEKILAFCPQDWIVYPTSLMEQSSSNIEMYTYISSIEHFLTSYTIFPTPKNALILGLGAAMLPRLFEKLYCDIWTDAVEIDRAVINACTCCFACPKRFTIINADAESMVYGSNKKYNLIAVDICGEKEMPSFLTDKHWFMRLMDLLTEDGVLIFNTFAGSETSEQVANNGKDFIRMSYVGGNKMHFFTKQPIVAGNFVDAPSGITLIQAPRCFRSTCA